MVYDELWKAADALEHLAEEAQAQHRASRYYTTTHTSSITHAGQIFENLHLPEEAAIASAYIENNSLVTHLTVYEGKGASGRVIGLVGPGRTKRVAVADYISSLSIVADVADPSSALVIVTISSHKWSPTSGTV